MNQADTTDARIDQNEIGKLYDGLANVYDIWAFLTETKARNRALQLAKIKDGQNILEIAVGTGYAFRQIVKENPNGKNVGIDLSEKMLNKAKARLSKINQDNYSLLNGTAFNISVKTETIDTLLNTYMFDLIPYQDMGQILVEFKRVLKKDGKLILVNMTKGEQFGSNIYEFFYKLSPRLMGGCRGIQLTEKLKQHGFKIQLREYHQQLLFPSEVILAYR